MDWLTSDGVRRVLDFLNNKVDLTVFVFGGLIMLFFLVSRRANARAEASSMPLLPKLARRILPPKRYGPSRPLNDRQKVIRGIRNGAAWLLQKTDWLLRDKLRLLPDEQKDHRLNYFFLLFSVCLVSRGKTFLDKVSASPEFRSSGSNEFFLGILLFLVLAILTFMMVVFLRKNREFYLDISASLALFYYAVNKIVSCHYYGCCFGVPCTWGIYNETIDTTVFPVQLLEAAALLICYALCVLYMLYGKTYKSGRGTSLALFLFAVTKFFIEFLRYHGPEYRDDEQNVLFGLSVVQLASIACVVLAIAWLFILPLEKKLMDKLWRFLESRIKWLTA